MGELRVKESDRLAAVTGQLERLSATTVIQGDDLVVVGPTPLTLPDRLESFGDHRIAMTLKMAGVLAGESAAIQDEDCIRISYPGFQEELDRLLSTG